MKISAVVLICLIASNAHGASVNSDRFNPKESSQMQVSEGYVTTADGVRLFFQKVGSGTQTVVVPNAIYMFDDFKHLSKDRTIIFFDFRNRGRSDEVTDDLKLKGGIHNDVEDIESVRRHFGLEKFDLLAHSYVGLVAGLYAMKYPARVNRAVQIGPVQPSMAKQYPPHLTNVDATAREVFTKIGQLQTQGLAKDPIESCKQVWSVFRSMYVFDSADAHKISAWGFCELANERNSMKYFNGSIAPSLKSLALTPSDYAKATMSVLVIHGTKDRNAPYGGGRDWAMSLPNARLVTVANAAHVPWVEAPELVFGSIKAFLEGKWPDAAEQVQSLDPITH